MKRTIGILSVLSLALVMTFATLAQTASAQQAPEKLGKGQLTSLIAAAKTPAEHQRIAQFYKSEAQDYLAQAKEHTAMVAAYKANSNINAKNQAATIGHCQYFASKFTDLAAKSQELAQLHEQMAKDAVNN
jgi:hypothetical protein